MLFRSTLFQRDLAISLLATGEYRHGEGQAAQAAEAYHKALLILERLPVVPAIDHINLAVIHAGLAGVAARPESGISAAEGRAEADRAMASLRKAVDGGYRPPLAMIRSDNTFNSLRPRTDFQLLMMDLAMPEKPFAQ